MDLTHFMDRFYPSGFNDNQCTEEANPAEGLTINTKRDRSLNSHAMSPSKSTLPHIRGSPSNRGRRRTGSGDKDLDKEEE